MTPRELLALGERLSSHRYALAHGEEDRDALRHDILAACRAVRDLRRVLSLVGDIIVVGPPPPIANPDQPTLFAGMEL